MENFPSMVDCAEGSEGVIKENEPPLIFQILQAGGPDQDGKTYGDRIDYAFLSTRENRGEAFIERVEGGYRKFSLYERKENYKPSLISWHYAFGFMFVIGGLGCFFISRRWR